MPGTNEYNDEAFAGDSADAYVPAIEAPHIPDYAALKASRKFGHLFRPNLTAYPAWMYHPTQVAVIVHSREERIALGPEWAPAPFDKKVPAAGTGKTVVDANRPQSSGSSAELMAAILQQLQRSGPSSAVQTGLTTAMRADPDYAEFLEFKKFKESQKPAGLATQDTAETKPAEVTDNLTPEEKKEILIGLAKEKGVKVDKRWSIESIQAELDKVAA